MFPERGEENPYKQQSGNVFRKLEKGQDVWIYYNGEVMESYPLQISEVLEMMIAK